MFGCAFLCSSSDQFHPYHSGLLHPYWVNPMIALADTAKSFGLLLDQGGILAWFCWYQTWLYIGVLPVQLIFYQQMSKDRWSNIEGYG